MRGYVRINHSLRRDILWSELIDGQMTLHVDPIPHALSKGLEHGPGTIEVFGMDGVRFATIPFDITWPRTRKGDSISIPVNIKCEWVKQ